MSLPTIANDMYMASITILNHRCVSSSPSHLSSFLADIRQRIVASPRPLTVSRDLYTLWLDHLWWVHGPDDLLVCAWQTLVQELHHCLPVGPDEFSNNLQRTERYEISFLHKNDCWFTIKHIIIIITTIAKAINNIIIIITKTAKTISNITIIITTTAKVFNSIIIIITITAKIINNIIKSLTMSTTSDESHADILS